MIDFLTKIAIWVWISEYISSANNNLKQQEIGLACRLTYRYKQTKKMKSMAQNIFCLGKVNPEGTTNSSSWNKNRHQQCTDFEFLCRIWYVHPEFSIWYCADLLPWQLWIWQYYFENSHHLRPQNFYYKIKTELLMVHPSKNEDKVNTVHIIQSIMHITVAMAIISRVKLCLDTAAVEVPSS